MNNPLQACRKALRQSNMAAALSLILVLSVVGLLITLLFIEIPESNKDIFNSGFNILATMAVAAAAYYHGSSKGSKDKTDAMAEELARDGS